MRRIDRSISSRESDTLDSRAGLQYASVMAVFLDSEYLGKLVEGSFETTVIGVSEAVAAKPDLFGEGRRRSPRSVPMQL